MIYLYDYGNNNHQKYDIFGHYTDSGKEYYRTAKTDGIEAALEYINEQDKEMENPES